MDRPNLSTRYVPSRKPLGTPNSPPRRPTTAPSPSIPPNNPTGLAPIAPMVPITARRSSTASRMVFTAMRTPTMMPASAVRLRLCAAVLEHGRQVRPGRACRRDAGDDAVDVGRDVSALSRQDERGRGVTGRGEHARGDVHGRGQQHVAVVDALDAVELRERPTQVRRTWRQARDAQLVAEL